MLIRVRQGKVSEGGSHYGSVSTQQCSTVTWRVTEEESILIVLECNIISKGELLII